MSTDELEGRAAEEPTTWPDLGIALYERLTGRGAEISYTFDELEVDVPNRAGEGAEHASWRLNGTLRVSTRDREE